MADGIIQVPLDSTGKKVDTAEIAVGANTVERQRIVIADNSASAQFALVTGGALMVTGTVSLGAGTTNIGGVSLVAGTANIGFINNISATVVVAGIVSLGAGTALIGAVSIAAGTANIGFINNISATVVVAGTISLGAGTANIGAISLGAGTQNIGFINNISATTVVGLSYVIEKTTNSQVQVGDSLNAAIRVNIVADSFASAVVATMSVSHGPKMIVASTSANVTLIASPGAGVSNYITQIMVTNSGALGTVGRIGTSASIATIAGYMASAGGGFVMNFDPPWKLSASEAALCSVKPNTSEAYFVVNYYVAV